GTVDARRDFAGGLQCNPFHPRCNRHMGIAGKEDTRMSKPGDCDTEQMIRVDQAGEFGATRIYAGQLAVMGDRAPQSPEIRAMAEQEAGHRTEFEALMARRGVRPTALQPLWKAAGF